MIEFILNTEHLRTIRNMGNIDIRIIRLSLALRLNFPCSGSARLFLESNLHDPKSNPESKFGPSRQILELRGLLILRFELIALCINSYGPQTSFLIFNAANDRLRRKGFPPCNHEIEITLDHDPSILTP